MAEDSLKITKDLKEQFASYAEPEPDTQFLETGNIGFDMAMSNGLGIPVGGSTLLWAGHGCGKTTLFADVAKRLIKSHKKAGKPFKVVYLAVEGSRELMKKLGLKEYMDSKDFIYIEKRFSWRQIEVLYELIIKQEPPYDGVKLVVIDSVNNVLSDQNLKSSIADGDFGTKARERGNFYGKYLPMCKQLGISTFMISQIRQKQDAMSFGEKKKAAVSDSDLHNADIIVKCKAVTDSKNPDVEKVAIKTAFGESKEVIKYLMELDPTNSSSKNRYDRTHKCEILIEKGVGCHNYFALRKILEFQGFLKCASGYFSFDKALCEAFDLPDKKLRREETNTIISEKTSELVTFLKEAGCYSITKEGCVRVDNTPDDEEEDDE